MFLEFDDFVSKKEKVAVVGLGYVGLPLAVVLGRLYQVIGFDINNKRIEELKNNYDKNEDISPEELLQSQIELTSEPEKLQEARLIIVTVPTPVDRHNIPDLAPLKEASSIIGRNLGKKSTVVYESTVYPGVTEEICVPVIEQQSGLKCGVDFKIGYSPERINPGDKGHTLPKIVKIVAGQDKKTAELLAAIYGSVIEEGVHVAPNIRTAEAAKVIENIQRDLNIALINELVLIFNKLEIDTTEVLQAAGTKWNFQKYEPGLVGGHCIGVDPYYLTYKAEEIGYHPAAILAGRRINNQMGKYIAEQTVKQLIKANKSVKETSGLLLGIAYKENVKDIRNTRIVDIYNELKEYGVKTYIYDPLVPADEVKHEFGIDLISHIEDYSPYDAIILAVKHKHFLAYSLAYLREIASGNPVLIDVKAVYNRKEAEEAGFLYWRL